MKRAVEIVPLQLASKARQITRAPVRLASNFSVRGAAFGFWALCRYVATVLSLSIVVPLRCAISRNSSADNDKQMFVRELAAAPYPCAKEDRDANAERKVDINVNNGARQRAWQTISGLVVLHIHVRFQFGYCVAAPGATYCILLNTCMVDTLMCFSSFTSTKIYAGNFATRYRNVCMICENFRVDGIKKKRKIHTLQNFWNNFLDLFRLYQELDSRIND